MKQRVREPQSQLSIENICYTETFISICFIWNFDILSVSFNLSLWYIHIHTHTHTQMPFMSLLGFQIFDQLFPRKAIVFYMDGFVITIQGVRCMNLLLALPQKPSLRVCPWRRHLGKEFVTHSFLGLPSLLWCFGFPYLWISTSQRTSSPLKCRLCLLIYGRMWKWCFFSLWSIKCRNCLGSSQFETIGGQLTRSHINLLWQLLCPKPQML